MNAESDAHRRSTALLPLRAGEPPLAAGALLGLAVSAVISIATGGYEFLFYIVVVAAIMALVVFIHRRIVLSLATLWALLLWALLHMAGGMLPLPKPTGVLYNLWLVPGVLKFDQLVHAFGFGVTAWTCWQVLRSHCPPPHTSPTLLAASALSAMGLGALNEEIEFAATKLVERTNVGDYDNNAWDLVFNMLGALVAVLLIRWIHPKPPTPRSLRSGTDPAPGAP